MKVFIFLSLVILAASQNTCTSVCTNADNGFCYIPDGATSTGYCSCFSGFKGPQCDLTPSRLNAFSPPDVDANQDVFSPILTATLMDTTARIVVSIPSSPSISNKGTQNSYSGPTYLTFRSNSPGKRATPDTKCNYPESTAWSLDTVKSGTVWMDTFTADFSFSDLHDCGLTKEAGYPSGFAIYNGTLEVAREFTVGNDRFSVVRTNSVEQRFSFAFPHVIVSVQSISVAPGPEIFAAWSDISYDRLAGKWALSFTTVSDQVVLDFPVGGAPDPGLTVQSNPRAFSYLGPVSTGDCTPSNTPGTDCAQVFTLKVEYCYLVDLSSYTIPMKLTCKVGAATCADGSFSLSLNLKTTSACPVSEAYNTAASIQPVPSKPLYLSTETITFGIKYTLPTSVVATVSTDKVCAYPSAGAPATPTPCANPAKYVTMITNPTNPDASVYKGVFAINAGDAKKKSGVIGINEIVVQADLILTYSGFSKRAETVEHAKITTFTIKLNDDSQDNVVEIDLGHYDESSAPSISVAIYVIGLLAFLLL